MRKSIISRAAQVARATALSCLCALTAFTGTVALAQVAPPPISVFASRPRTSMPRLSPDGKHLLVTQRMALNEQDVSVMVFSRLPDMAVLSQVRLPAYNVPVDYWWVSNTRVVVSTGRVSGTLEGPVLNGELMAMNLDGSDQEYLFGSEMGGRGKRATQNNDRSYGFVSGIAEERDGRFFVEEHSWYSNASRTMLHAINAKGGTRKLMAEVGIPRASFLVQRNGAPRYAFVTDEQSLMQVLQYSDEKKEWLSFNGQERKRLTPLAFSADDSAIYASLSDNGGPASLVRQSVANGQRDILATDSVGDIHKIEWSARKLSPIAATTLVGVPWPRYINPASPEAQLHKSLSAQFPGSYVSFDSFSDDGQKLLFSVRSDRDPGTFYLLDRQTSQAQELFTAMPGIDPARMGERRPIQFKARDGLPLHGFLTLPPGRGDKNLPLVLLPHGGPHGLSDSWFFDRDAQFLASRGYAVLQVNYRGSGGRGKRFEAIGWRHWGDHMQDDVIDGVRWAVAEGIADKDRMCAYGGSYGAYSSMMSAIRAPELFKCIAGYAGVYDLAGMFETDETKFSPNATAYWSRVLGKDADELTRFSPAMQADKIKVPVLLVHGEEDRRTPFSQAKSMRDALQAAGKPFESMFVPNEGHGFYAERNRIAFYEKLEAFLARHIGPGVVKGK